MTYLKRPHSPITPGFKANPTASRAQDSKRPTRDDSKPHPKNLLYTTDLKAGPSAEMDDLTKDRGYHPPLKRMRRSKVEPLQDVSCERQSLPIWSARNALVKEIRNNDAVIVLGETGSGKTTQIPQFIFDAGLCERPLMIAVTQPRRVAATSLAARVSKERGTRLGSLVGYSVRFDENSSADTRIKYMTDGMLGRELLNDPLLSRYGIIIVDEAHERTLRTDLLLTALKSILARRNTSSSWNAQSNISEAGSKRHPPTLKLIVMSATLDAQRFSDFFDGAKILYIKGRQHPVSVLHTSSAQSDYNEAALQTFWQIHTEQEAGDVLIFLPGQDDIESLESSIKSLSAKVATDQMGVMVCPLYAALPQAAQTAVFERPPANMRKVILSTNIAETSITIPGVKFVIDTGLFKEKRYFARGRGNGVDALLLQPISKSSALQRTGRAGREREGWCYRLYTEETFSGLRQLPIPEVQRCNLTFAILQMKCIGQNLESADFMDNPPIETVKSSLAILYSLGALDSTGSVTSLGRRIASFPLDPPQARAIIESTKHSSTSSLLSVLSLLSTSGKIFHASKDNTTAAEAYIKFRHRLGDHLTLLNVLRAYEQVLNKNTIPKHSIVELDRMEDSTTSGRQWCKTNFLNERALKEALNIRKQLRESCDREQIDWKVTIPANPEGDEKDDEGVLRSLLTGLWQYTATIAPDGGYQQVIGHQPVKVHPSSALFGRKCPAIMYHELLFTSSTYAMTVSSIPQAWLTDISLVSKGKPVIVQDKQ